MIFADDLARLVHENVTNRSPSAYITPLLSALGCRHLAEDEDSGEFELCKPSQPTGIEEPAVVAALLLALDGHMMLVDSNLCELTIEDEGVSILDGLSKNERWRACLSDSRMAFNLARLLMMREDHGSMSSVAQLSREVGPAALEILNNWIAPAAPYASIPASHDVANALFADVWCALVLDNQAMSNEETHAAVLADRPPFKPGLVAETLGEGFSLPPLSDGI